MFTLEQVKQGLLDAVAERGADYVYKYPILGEDTCMYVNPDGEPGCIVGLVLHRLGVSLDALRGDDGTEANRISVGSRGELALAPDARFLLGRVQSLQDRRTPWGEAVRRALSNEL